MSAISGGMSPAAFVDDDVEFLRTIESWQMGVGMPAKATSSPEESLDWVRKREVGVLVSDLRMPGLDGVDLLERARELSKGVRLVLCTGYTPSEQELVRLNRISAQVLSRTTDLNSFLSSLLAEPPDPATSRLAEVQERLEVLEKVHREWTADLLEQIGAVPNARQAFIAGVSEPTSVADMIRDIEALTPRGIEYIRLWRSALKRLRTMGRKI